MASWAHQLITQWKWFHCSFAFCCSVSCIPLSCYALPPRLLPSLFLLSAFTSSPLLCGPAVIILQPLCFTVMSPHLCLIVFASQFRTWRIFNTFFLLALNHGPHSSFLSRPAHFTPRLNLYQYFHSFPFFTDVIAFDCRKTSTVLLPGGWKWWRGVLWRQAFVGGGKLEDPLKCLFFYCV